MDQPRFNVGDEVVALTNPMDSYCQPRKKGDIYIVESVSCCHKCGVQHINIGPISYTGAVTFKCGCGASVDNNGLHWTNAKYFALIQNMTAQIEQALEEPITCT